MRFLTRLRAEPIEGASAPTRIDRYLGTSDHATRLAYTGVPVGAPDVSITLIDTSDNAEVTGVPSDHATLWHVLWARDEERATVTVAAAGRAQSWPIAPGDTVAVPAGARLRAEGGQLALAVTLPGGDVAPTPPTHGSEEFFGYNRRTIAFEAGGIRLCRWKLTQPLALAEHHASPVIVLALARSVVARTGTSIDRLAQGEAAVIDPATEPVVMPDGLTYLLTIERDVS